MVAINDVLMKLMDAYTKGDLVAAGTMMMPDIVAFGSTFNASNAAEVAAKAAPTVKGIKSALPLEKPNVTMSGNLAFATFRTDVHREGAAGAETRRLRWTVVFQKANDRWLVSHFHTSSEPS
jgi:ketosteroid isomerase-like protein